MAKIGRNDPCPCGSGKKYKKCCLKKDEAAQQPRLTPMEELTASSDEHLNPAVGGDGQGRLHPYALAKMLDAPDIVGLAGKKWGKLKELWTPSKVTAMSTEEIEQRLREVGIDSRRELFLEEARIKTSAWEVSRMWLVKTPASFDASDDDFAGLAACELWKRYCPDRPSVEMLGDWMQEGYVHLDKGRLGEACDIWLELWQVILERLSPEMRAVEDAEDLVASTQSIFDWIQDLSDSLHNTTIRDARHAEPAIEFYRQALEAFPDEHFSNRNLFRTEMAFMYYRLGQEVEGERILLDLIEEQPHRATGYVCLSDELSSHPPGGNQPRDLDRAIRLLEEAFERPVDDADGWDVERRLEYLREQKGATPTDPPRDS